jgi:TRAP-type C4-dicarboxylate transport system substrate-binding protein
MNNSHYTFIRRCINAAGFLTLLFVCANATAARPLTIKLATVAPKGSVYHRVLQEMGEKWRAAQGGNARFIIYTDGTQGTEAETVRRLRIGQLQASMLTTVGLMEIEPTVVAMQFMPMTYRNFAELDHVLTSMRPKMESDFANKGYRVLLWGMGGWVQFFSDRPRVMPEEFLGAKIFTWAGTKDQENIMKSMGYRPIVLDMSDILPAVQTGMVDVIPAAPVWALAGQFYRNTPHMLRVNWVPIVGATVLSNKTWDAMHPRARVALTEAAAQAEATLREHRTRLDEGAIEAMQKRGLTVHEPTAEVEQAWRRMMEPVMARIRGTLVPAETFDTVQSLLAEYRVNHQ